MAQTGLSFITTEKVLHVRYGMDLGQCVMVYN